MAQFSCFDGRLVFERDDGLWSIGLGDDAPGPFASRAFAQSVASGHQPVPAPIAKFRRLQIRERRDGRTLS
jgi:hypothetical protein